MTDVHKMMVSLLYLVIGVMIGISLMAAIFVHPAWIAMIFFFVFWVVTMPMMGAWEKIND